MRNSGFCKRGEITGKKVIGIIFLITGVMLMFFIISQSIGIYSRSRAESDNGSFGAQCVGFIYTITGITATGEELQFEFRNGMSSTEDVHNLTITAEGQEGQAFQLRVPIGTSIGVRVPARVADKFSVYPDGCGMFPAKCTLKEGCTYK